MGADGFFNQHLSTILWKTFKHRQRKIVVTVLFELLLPILIIIMLCFVDKSVKANTNDLEEKFNNLKEYKRMTPPICHSDNPLWTSGILDWIQGTLCNSSIPCQPKTFDDMNYLDLILKYVANSSAQNDMPESFFHFSKIFCGSRRNFTLQWNKNSQIDFNKEHHCETAKKLLPSSNFSHITMIFEKKFYFYPNNTLTNQVMVRLEETLKKMFTLKDAATFWRESYSSALKNSLSQESTREKINKDLEVCIEDNKNCKDFVCNRTLIRCKTLQKYLPQLGDWSGFIEVANVAFGLAESIVDCLKFPKFIAAKSKDELYFKTHSNGDIMGILFNGLNEKTNISDIGHWSFKFVDGDLKNKENNFQIGLSTVTIYELFTQTIIEILTGNTVSQGTSLREIPRKCKLNHFFQEYMMRILYNMIQVLLILCWMPSFCFTTIAIVSEKERRLTFTMKLLSVKQSQIWFGWFTYAFPLFIMLTFATVIFFALFHVVEYSSLILLQMILLIYSIVCILQSFFISTLFETSKMASIVSPLLYLFGTIIRYFVSETTPRFLVWVLCLIPQVAIYISLKTMFHLEDENMGLRFDTVDASFETNNSVYQMVMLLMLTGAIFLFLMVYIETVFPGELGIGLVWYYPLTKSYWTGEKEENNPICQTPKAEERIRNKYFEDDPVNLAIGVEIIDLVKRYNKTAPCVVDSLSLNFYVDQITAFLGHNGAGKTTTLSIIAGIFPPTSGRILINGYDTQTNPATAQGKLGLCPQYNVLFNYLTVEEHVVLYSSLKGLTTSDIEETSKQVLMKIDLYRKRDNLVTALSGGMKRRLSVGLAFLGNPTAVILDEPTAGVDPYARREIWDVILAHKKGTAIILTSHHMDEADILGDRIAIISKGRLKCCGTSMFLKRNFGHGYLLNLCIPIKENPDLSYLTRYVNKYVPSSKFIKQTDDEIIFELPRSGCDNGQYETLFIKLERDKVKLHVENFGLNNTSLETIFVELISDNSCKIEKSNKNDKHGNTVTMYKESETAILEDKSVSVESESSGNRFNPQYFKHRLTGPYLYRTQFLAILKNKAIFSLRGKSILMGHYIVPVLLIIISMMLYNSFLKIPEYYKSVKIFHKEYFPWNIGRDTDLHVFYSNENKLNPISNELSDLFESSLGFGGVRCMNPAVYSITKYPCNWEKESYEWKPYIPSKFLQRCSVFPTFKKWPVRKRSATSDFLYKLEPLTTELWLQEHDDKISGNLVAGFNFGSGVHPLEANAQIEMVSFFKGIFVVKLDNADYFWKTLQKFLSNGGASTTSVTTFWHQQDLLIPYDTALSYMGILMNLNYRRGLTRKNDTGISLSINSTTFKLDNQKYNSNREKIKSASLTIIRQAFTLATCSVLLFLVDERVSVSKYLQIISGIQPSLYWLANIVWDMVNAILLTVMLIVLIRIVGWWEFVSLKHVFIIMAFIILFCAATLAMMYVLSYFGNSPGKFVLVTFVTIELIVDITEVFVVMAQQYETKEMQALESDDNIITKIANILKVVILIVPHYSFKTALLIAFNYYHNKTYPEDQEMPVTVTSSLMKEFLSQFGCLIGYSLILLFLEYSPISYEDIVAFYLKKFNLCKENSPIEDADVTVEEIRVKSEKDNTDALRLKRLSKIYTKQIFKRFTAVSNVSLGLRSGECFGLLGVNGAGKTTSFKMMTGEYAPTKGKILIKNIDIQKNRHKALRKIGYCPQFNGFCEIFTVREVLQLHANLCGIHPDYVDNVVSFFINAVSLTPHSSKQSGQLSGGNKRKLSTCIALIGNPDVVLLDEPTSGMDTAARRELWDCINEVVARGKCVVLTSHSLEECEALCQRACIMASGQLCCLGSIQHLKSKFGRGYRVTMSLNIGRTSKELKMYMRSIESASLLEEHEKYIEYELPFTVPLSVIFQKLQSAKLKHGLIEEYAINQTTLDDVFIVFAREDNDRHKNTYEI